MVLVAELRTNFCIRSLRLVKVLAVLLLIWGCVAKSRMQHVDLAGRSGLLIGKLTRSQRVGSG